MYLYVPFRSVEEVGRGKKADKEVSVCVLYPRTSPGKEMEKLPVVQKQ